MRTKTPPDMLWNITVIIFISIGMTIGYIFNETILPNCLLSSITNKSLYYSVVTFYLFILLIGLASALECFYREREIYFQRTFPSKILLNIALSYAISFIWLSLFLKEIFIVTIVNIVIGYILCKTSFSVIEFIKRRTKCLFKELPK